jgi:hypothetical protein
MNTKSINQDILHAECSHCGREIFRNIALCTPWRHLHNDSPACVTIGGTQAEPTCIDQHGVQF